MDLSRLFRTKGYLKRERDLARFRELVEKNKKVPDFSAESGADPGPSLRPGQWYQDGPDSFVRVAYVYERDDPPGFAPQHFVKKEDGDFEIRDCTYAQSMKARDLARLPFLDDLKADEMEALYQSKRDRIQRDAHYEELEGEYQEILRGRDLAGPQA